MRRRGAALFSAPILIYYYIFFLGGCIAQLVEHWAFNLMVAGSSPAIPKPALHSTMSKDSFVASKMTLWPLDSLQRLRPLSDKGGELLQVESDSESRTCPRSSKPASKSDRKAKPFLPIQASFSFAPLPQFFLSKLVTYCSYYREQFVN